jgi:hypothetical protein
MITLCLVLDTNIIISVALSPRSLPRTALLVQNVPTRLADYLITDNLRHFPRFWKKTKIVGSRQFHDLVAPHLCRVNICPVFALWAQHAHSRCTRTSCSFPASRSDCTIWRRR